MASDTTRNALPQAHRFITTHNEKGEAVYSSDLSDKLEFWSVDSGEGQSKAGFELGYTTEGFPIPLTADKDLDQYKEVYASKKESGLVKHGGTVLRYVDIPPEGRSAMHRTVSLDYGIVITGELECLLDSGETRTVRPGDVMVQRGTMHQWINRSQEWARIVFILFHAAPVEVNGRLLGEETGAMGVPESH